jgi:hypothetical protein
VKSIDLPGEGKMTLSGSQKAPREMVHETRFGSDYVKVSFDKDELRHLKSVVVEGRAIADRMSTAFAFRLIQAFANRLGYHEILDELDYLEGVTAKSRTKPAEPFKGRVLKPLWHKHFSAPRHMLKNIGIHWEVGKKDTPAFNRLIAGIAKAGSDHWVSQLCYQFVIGGYQERLQNRGLTGDWIIFAKHDGHNYYLDIATHIEGNDDQVLMKKIRCGSEAEFPFLFG